MAFTIRAPFFEIGPKAYLYGKDALELGLIAEQASIDFDVKCIFTPQLTDIHLLAEHTRHLLICAQKIDNIAIGRGQGSILPEAVKAAGAHGTMLNHSECPISLADLRLAIQRAREAGLFSIVCADSIMESGAVAMLGPDIVVAEPSELIGSGITSPKDYIDASIRAVKAVNDSIYVLQGAGISSADDVYQVIFAGADATGSSSAICKARDPEKMVREMFRAARQGYNDRTKSKSGKG